MVTFHCFLYVYQRVYTTCSHWSCISCIFRKDRPHLWLNSCCKRWWLVFFQLVYNRHVHNQFDISTMNPTVFGVTNQLSQWPVDIVDIHQCHGQKLDYDYTNIGDSHWVRTMGCMTMYHDIINIIIIYNHKGDFIYPRICLLLLLKYCHKAFIPLYVHAHKPIIILAISYDPIFPWYCQQISMAINHTPWPWHISLLPRSQTWKKAPPMRSDDLGVALQPLGKLQSWSDSLYMT